MSFDGMSGPMVELVNYRLVRGPGQKAQRVAAEVGDIVALVLGDVEFIAEIGKRIRSIGCQRPLLAGPVQMSGTHRIEAETAAQSRSKSALQALLVALSTGRSQRTFTAMLPISLNWSLIEYVVAPRVTV